MQDLTNEEKVSGRGRWSRTGVKRLSPGRVVRMATRYVTEDDRVTLDRGTEVVVRRVVDKRSVIVVPLKGSSRPVRVLSGDVEGLVSRPQRDC